ncbi:hypothetical protein RBI22_00305 [Alcaligenaceae bacterium C4P045]|nr:hypothetical protein [Alcaligenaceae bacterium C4P045]
MTDRDPSPSAAKEPTSASAHEASTTPGHVAPENARAFPPSGPVDVPNLPKAVKNADQSAAGAESAEAAQSTPEVDTTKHSWADNTQPAPDKKNARSSIL